MRKKPVFKYRGQNVTFDLGNVAANKMLTQELIDSPAFQSSLNQSIGRIMDQHIRREKLLRLKKLEE